MLKKTGLMTLYYRVPFSTSVTSKCSAPTITCIECPNKKLRIQLYMHPPSLNLLGRIVSLSFKSMSYTFSMSKSTSFMATAFLISVSYPLWYLANKPKNNLFTIIHSISLHMSDVSAIVVSCPWWICPWSVWSMHVSMLPEPYPLSIFYYTPLALFFNKSK